jgi:hypothetical protein
MALAQARSISAAAAVRGSPVGYRPFKTASTISGAPQHVEHDEKLQRAWHHVRPQNYDANGSGSNARIPTG